MTKTKMGKMEEGAWSDSRDMKWLGGEAHVGPHGMHRGWRNPFLDAGLGYTGLALAFMFFAGAVIGCGAAVLLNRRKPCAAMQGEK